MSRLCHCLFLISSLFTLVKCQTDNVKVNIEMSKREDGLLSAFLFIGNGHAILADWNISLNLNAITNGPKRRMEFSGLLFDGRTNRTTECSCSKSDLMAEQNKMLRLLCPKEGDEQLKVILRREWDAKPSGRDSSGDKELKRMYGQAWGYHIKQLLTLERRRKPAEFIIASTHIPLLCNFYIEDNGSIVEGLGWDNISYSFNSGIEARSIIIGFVKKTKPNPSPSEPAISAYESLIRQGICKGKLSTAYVLIPYYLIWDHVSLKRFNRGETPIHDDFERKEMRNWNGYSDNVDFLFPLKSEENRILPVVSIKVWKGARPNESIKRPPLQMENLIVMSFTPRCFSDCGKYLKSFLKNKQLPFNFFVGEDGNAYEGLGWENFEPGLRADQEKKKFVLVLFLGTFQTYPPHRRALNALNNLVKEGLKTRRLSPNYKITTFLTGEHLTREISKMFKHEVGEKSAFNFILSHIFK